MTCSICSVYTVEFCYLQRAYSRHHSCCSSEKVTTSSVVSSLYPCIRLQICRYSPVNVISMLTDCYVLVVPISVNKTLYVHAVVIFFCSVVSTKSSEDLGLQILEPIMRFYVYCRYTFLSHKTCCGRDIKSWRLMALNREKIRELRNVNIRSIRYLHSVAHH